MGYVTVADSARAIIAERLARGETRRPDLVAFARQVLRRDIEKYVAQPLTSEWVFFDRGVVDALGLLHEVSPVRAMELNAVLAAYRFHSSAFVLPPWEAIFTNDAERDQSFGDAVRVHVKTVRWYRECGYLLHEVPRLPAAERAQHVLSILTAGAV